MATFTFDGPNKRIEVDAELGDSSFTPVELYSAWKDWIGAGNAQYLEAFAESVGGNDLGGGTSLDAYIFLRNDLGWRIRPDARDHTLVIDGNLYGADANTTLFAATVSPATVQIERSFSSRAVGVATSGSAAPTATENANAVWSHASATDHTARLVVVSKVLRNKTTTNRDTGVMTVYDDDGASVLFTCQVYEDTAGSQTYRGQGIDRRDRLV